ncbi:hypothetical protein [Methylorubrum extorquens]|uniref:Uncharacterized protein n=1 Tax=Methylorubrum extorquens TaxID=408 RepID=A0AAX3WJJ1_METEX|nr:hypothetical protein [Methylorubrum extorquens]WHQ70502.1 hypothetical protein KEC54_02350 [Methylorubrum extorquens]
MASVSSALRDGGGMGAPMIGLQHPSGRMSNAPPALLPLVWVMINLRKPMFIACGANRTPIYDDTYAPMLGERHPAALGHPFFETWPEVRDEVGAQKDRVYAGESVHMDDLHLTLHRNGYPRLYCAH